MFLSVEVEVQLNKAEGWNDLCGAGLGLKTSTRTNVSNINI